METKEDLIKAFALQLMRISNIHARIEDHLIRFDEGVEMTPKEIHTIQAIGKHEQMNVTGVAAYFRVTKAAASQMVARLADKGFVRKEYVPHSNKELQLSLTELGWRAFHAHERLHEEHLADLVDRLGSFTLPQVATALTLLEVIENVLEDRMAKI